MRIMILMSQGLLFLETVKAVAVMNELWMIERELMVLFAMIVLGLHMSAVVVLEIDRRFLVLVLRAHERVLYKLAPGLMIGERYLMMRKVEDWEERSVFSQALEVAQKAVWRSWRAV
jgi:hypothetical protein